MRSKTPPAKFDNEPCKAKPTAKPAAPKIVTNEVVPMPIIPATVTIKITFKPTDNKLNKNVRNETSKSFLSIAFEAILASRLMNHKPINKTKNAPINFGV